VRVADTPQGTSGGRPPRRAFLVLLALGVSLVAGLAVHGPIFDAQGYHDFADRRAWLGIPNALDVLSNLPFLAVALVGWGLVSGWSRASRPPGWERAALGLMLAGFGLTCVGSTLYHVAPSAWTLVWDRLPMALTFGAFFALFLGDRLGPAAGRRLLVPWVAFSIASVVVWRLTFTGDRGGDLRLYALAQYLPAAAALLLLLFIPPPRREARWVWAALAAYAVAKGLEALDGPVFEATLRTVSGHTLKHVAAAAAAWCLVRWAVARGAGESERLV